MSEAVYDFSRGLNNSEDDSKLDPGEATRAIGVVYKRNSQTAFQKAGRTAYDSTVVDSPGAGLFYAEFSNATSKILVRAGTKLYAGDRGVSGTLADVASGGLNTDPIGLWGTYAFNRYFLADGASAMQLIGTTQSKQRTT